MLLRSESDARVDSQPSPWPAGVRADRPVHLRLIKHGDSYTASVSSDGRTWRDAGVRRNVSMVGPRVGVYAFGADQRSPATVRFTAFRL